MYRKTREMEIACLDLDGETIQGAICELNSHQNSNKLISEDNPLYMGDPYIDICEMYGCITVRLVQKVYTETEEEFNLRKEEESIKKGGEVEQLKRRLRELGEVL